VTWLDRKLIEPSVLNMFRVNMGLRDKEKVLVVTDPPLLPHWREDGIEEIAAMAERALLARTVADVAIDNFKGCEVGFFAYPPVARSGAEPGEEVAARMKAADVVIAITNRSLSHTDARVQACQAGARVASMPGFLTRMFYPDGPMAADSEEVARLSRAFAKRLTNAREARIRSASGTDLALSLEGREGLADHGLFTQPGDFGNLPAGEAYIAPVEGSGQGRLVVPAGWWRGLAEDMTLTFEDGLVRSIEGGGQAKERLLPLLGLGEGMERDRARCNLAELGIGTNPFARSVESGLEAEKIKGTIHIAIGDNAHMGGRVSTDLHFDMIIPQVDLFLDGEKVIGDGEWLIAQ
jgi:leucyl aminopeptidase (aminopeptidase T)